METPKLQLQKFSEWSAQNPTSDEVEARLKYNDYTTNELLNTGKLTPFLYSSMQQQQNLSLLRSGYGEPQEITQRIKELRTPTVVDDVNFLERNAKKGSDFSVKADVLNTEDQELIEEFKKQTESGEYAEGFLESFGEKMRAKREDLVKYKFNNEELPIGVYYDKKGVRTVLGGGFVEGTNEVDVLRSGETFGAAARDILTLRPNMAPNEEGPNNKDNYSRFRLGSHVHAIDSFFEEERFGKAKASVQALAMNRGKDRSMGWSDRTLHRTLEFIEDEFSYFRKGLGDLQNLFSDEAKVNTTEMLLQKQFKNTRDYAEDFNQEELYSSLKNSVSHKLGRSGPDFDIAFEDYVNKVTNDGAGGAYGFESTLLFDEDDLKQNVTETTVFGPIVKSELNFKEEEYKAALTEKGVSKDLVKFADAKRRADNELNYDEIDKVLSAKEPEKWTEAKQAAKGLGLSGGETVEKFVKDNPDFNFKSRGLLQSVGHSYQNIYYGVKAMAGSESAVRELQANAREVYESRKFAETFGVEMGLGYELSEQAAPMVADMIVSATAAVAAKPTGGLSLAALATYFTTKASAKAVVKTMYKSVTSRAFYKSAAESGIEASSIAALSSLSPKEATVFLKAYSSNLAKDLAIDSATFVPAALRSGSSTYEAVYTSLETSLTQKHFKNGQWDEGWSKERVHEEAHEGGQSGFLVGGAFTGFLTAGMGRIAGGGTFGGKTFKGLKGSGGLETAFLKGVTYKQFKTAASRVAGYAVTDKGLTGLLKTAMRQTFTKRMGGRATTLVGSALGEGFEEGLDEVVNSLIQDVYTNETTPMHKIMQQGLMGFKLGMAMGAAGPALKYGASKTPFLGNKLLDKKALNQMEKDLIVQFDKNVQKKAAQDTELAKKYDELKKNAPQVFAVLQERGIPTAETQNQTDEGATNETKLPQQPTDKAQKDKIILDDAERILNEDIQQERDAGRWDNMTSEQQQKFISVRGTLATHKAQDLADAEAKKLKADLDSAQAKSDKDELGGALEQVMNEDESSDTAEVSGNQALSDVLELLGKESLTKELGGGPVGATSYQTPEQKKADAYDRIQRSNDLYVKAKSLLDSLPEDQKQDLENKINELRSRGILLTDTDADKARSFIDKQFDRETTEEQEQGPITEGDTQQVSELIEAGYPVSLIMEHLAAFNLNLDKAEPKDLKQLSKYISDKIEEKYPAIKIKSTKKNPLIKLPDLFSSDRSQRFVYLDENGAGIFNNDPQSMLTFFSGGFTIPVSEEIVNLSKQENSQVNPAFEFNQVDGQWQVTDIHIPTRGGLVSAVSYLKPDQVVDHISDYRPVRKLVNEVKGLQDTVIPDDVKVKNPFKDMKRLGVPQDKEISLSDLLALVKDPESTMPKRLVERNAAIRKTKDSGTTKKVRDRYYKTAAITFRLQLEKRIYQTAIEIAQGKTGPRFNVTELANAEVEANAKIAAARAEQAGKTIAQLIDKGSQITRRGDQIAPEVAEDTDMPADLDPLPTLHETGTDDFLHGEHDEIVDVLESDPELRALADEMLDSELHDEPLTFVSAGLTSRRVADNIVYLFSQGNNISNSKVVDFLQKLKELSDNGNQSATQLDFSIRALGIGNPMIGKDPDADPEFSTYLGKKFEEVFGFSLNEKHIDDFHTRIKKGSRQFFRIGSGKNNPKIISENIKDNREAIEELGLASGDPESVIAALEKIEKSGPKILRVVAKMLLKNKAYIRSVKFKIESSLETYAGMYNAETNTVTINPVRKASGQYGLQGTLLHEFIHAFTVDMMFYGADLRTKTQDAAFAELNRLRKYVRRRATMGFNRNARTATASMEEFVAYILTDKDFQTYVQNVTAEPNKKHGVFESIVRAIAKFLDKKIVTLNEGLEAAFAYTADSVFTIDTFTRAVSKQVFYSTGRASRIAKDLDISGDAEVQLKLLEDSQNLLSFARGYVPDEIVMQVDETSRVIAKIDDETGHLIFNPIRAAVKLNSMELSNRRKEAVLAALMNEEIGHAAANQMLTDQQILGVANSMVEDDFVRALEAYYPQDQQAEALERLRSEDPETSSVEKYKLANEFIVEHASRAIRGTTTNQQIAFLSTNPSLIPTFVQYLKALLSKLVYHRSSQQLSDETRLAVNNVVREIRAMELGYRPSSGQMEYNMRNSEQIIETMISQFAETRQLAPVKNAEPDTIEDSFPDDPARGYFKEWAHGSNTEGIVTFDPNQSTNSEGLGAGVYFAGGNRWEGTYGGSKVNYVVNIRLKNPILVKSHTDGGNKLREFYEPFMQGVIDKYGLTPEEADQLRSRVEKNYKDFNFSKTPNEIFSAGFFDTDASYFEKLKPLKDIMVGYLERPTRGGGQSLTSSRTGRVSETGTQPMLDLFTELTGFDGIHATEKGVLVSWNPAEQVEIIEEQVDGKPKATNRDLESQFGSDSKIPQFLTPVELQEKEIGSWFSHLDVNIMDFSKYDIDAPEKNNWSRKIKRTAIKWLSRRGDRRLVSFYMKSVAFAREIANTVSSFQAEHDTLLAQENKRLGVDIPAELIAIASGASKGTELKQSQIDQIQNDYLDEVNAAKRLVGDARKAAEEAATAKKERATKDARIGKRDSLLQRRDAALSALYNQSPKMYALVVKMRDLQDKLSLKAMEVFGPSMNPHDLEMAFDFNRGIYYTRRYRMFEDNDFAEQVLDMSDDTYAKEREAAAMFFARKKAMLEIPVMVKKTGISPKRAARRIDLEISANNSKHMSQGMEMVRDFIKGYEKNKNSKKLKITNITGQQQVVMPEQFKDPTMRALANQINEKKDIPDEIRAVLGEYGDSEGIENLSSTLLHTSSLVANQSFFNKIKELGTKSQEPWLITQEEYDNPPADDPDKYADWSKVADDQGDSDLMPLRDMYAPDHVIRDFADVFKQGRKEYTDLKNEREGFIAKMGSYVKQATGLSLAVNTLGAFGFYIRNLLGNGAVLGPLQGYYGSVLDAIVEPVKLLKEVVFTEAEEQSSLLLRAVRGDTAEVDFYLAKLRTLDVYGDEVEANVIKNLLTGRVSRKQLIKDLKAIGRIEKKASEIINKSSGKKIPTEVSDIMARYGIVPAAVTYSTVKQASKALIDLGGRLAQASDGIFKIGMYDFELQTLIEAAKQAPPNDPRSKLIFEEDGKIVPSPVLEEQAAEIVKNTAQAYSKAMPWVKSFTNNPISNVFGTFVRFAAEPPRIFFSGLAQARRELKDPNPVIKARGRRRFFGYVTTVGASLAVTKGSELLLGDNEEEKEQAWTTRMGLPTWMQDSGLTFFKSGGSRYVVDHTFVNPLSSYLEPFMRGIESFAQGDDPLTTANEIFGMTGLAKPFLQEQIFAKAFIDVVVLNEDTYGNRIVDKADENKLTAQANYILQNAYMPRSGKAVYDAGKALYSDKSERMFSSPLGILMKEFMPFKPFLIEPDRIASKAFRDNAANTRENKRLLDLGQSDGMLDGEIYANYDKAFLRQKRYNRDLNRMIKGLNSMGYNVGLQQATAMGSGISKQRFQLSYVGLGLRPQATAFQMQKHYLNPRDATRQFKQLNYANSKYPNVVIPLEE